MTSSIPRPPSEEREKEERKKRKGRGEGEGEEKERERSTRCTSRGWSLPRGVGTVCSRVGERVALSCGDVEGEGKGLKVRDSLQHCEHTPA